MKTKIGFIGLGLIGGSIAKAIRQYYPDYEIVAFDKNKETLALAVQESVIDTAGRRNRRQFPGRQLHFPLRSGGIQHCLLKAAQGIYT